MPEKSGIGALLGVPLVVGPPAGAAVCPKTGVATAKAKAITTRKPCRHWLMITSASWLALHLAILKVRFVRLRDRKQVLAEMVLVVFRADHLHQRVRHLAP